jgi:Ion channel
VHPLQIWAYGLGLIILTIVVHATSVALMGLAQRGIWAKLESRNGNNPGFVFARWVGMCALIGLFLVTLHGLEIILWALVYCRVGALPSFADAIFFSMGSMTTAGASGLELQQHWRMLGTIEAVDGMLLFGISTAFIFALMQRYWLVLANDVFKIDIDRFK